MSDGEGAVVRLAAAEEDPLHQDIFIRLFSSSSSSSSSPSSSSSLTVCAPAAWLSRVPYFATQLTEPCIDSSPPQQIALVCTPGSSPQAYLQCLRLLRSSPISWPPLLVSVSEVLQILPVADHLLFQECWDACMDFLASFPWSMDEEDAIRATISKLNMEPSPDVKERLDTSHDGAVLETLLHKMLSTPSLEDSFRTWSHKCLNHSSAPFAEAFHSILLKVMESLSPKDHPGFYVSLSRAWYMLAKFLLEFTDAQQFILKLVNSEHLLQALRQSSREDDRHIFNKVLEKVEKILVLLSNLQRAKLVKWSSSDVETGKLLKFAETLPFSNLQRTSLINWSSSAVETGKLLKLAETLPFSNSIRMDLIKNNSQVVPEWIDRVSHRVSQMDEAGLRAVLENFGNKNHGFMV